LHLIFASRNADKLAELRDALRGLPIEVSSAADHPEIPEVEETGATLEENALLKARASHRATGQLCLADDTGLEIDALGGEPGVRSARYGGPSQEYARNVAKVLAAMRAVPEGQRAARFRTAVALVFPDGREEVVSGECAGRILAAPRGSGGFGYDPLFEVPELGRTFAELTLAEKQRISHRGRAMRLARRALERWLASA
jgi:XTP/dITP diphosphohydrolase